MKRDMELIRDILLRIEDCDDITARQLNSEWKPAIFYHAWLLTDAGFVTGIRCETDPITGEVECYLVPKPTLTWAGHEFLDAARDESTWVEAKSRIGKGLGSVSIGVLTAVLIDIAKEKLGLPR